MERQTRAQQRADAIDVSPARLAAEIERLTKERDLSRRQVELAREEIARLKSGAGAQPGAAAPSAPPAPTIGRIAGLKKRGGNDDLARERDDYLAALQRERAEFMNFKRRTAEEREQMLGLAAESLVRKFIVLADDFDLAVGHRPETGVDEAWVEGITAIDRKLRQLLESEGVSPIEAEAGSPFDPHEHEAVATVPGTGLAGGAIVQELRRGYRLRDRVIRPALVAVADDSAAQPETEPTEPIH